MMDRTISSVRNNRIILRAPRDCSHFAVFICWLVCLPTVLLRKSCIKFVEGMGLQLKV